MIDGQVIVDLRMRKIRATVRDISIPARSSIYVSDMGKKRRVVEQFGNKIGYWSGKGESREFIALTNFGVRILKFIEAPSQLPDYKGFLVEVTQDRKRTAVKGYGSNATFMLCMCNCVDTYNSIIIHLDSGSVGLLNLR